MIAKALRTLWTWCWTAAIPVVLLVLMGLTYTLGVSGQHTEIPADIKGSNSLNGDRYTSCRVLNVPYVEQGASNWCFQSSLSMVLQYYGEEVDPAEISGALGLNKNQSTSFIHIFFGSVDSYLSNWPELSIRHHVGNWDFSKYAEIIDAGSPVITSTFGFPGHTLVVVGYSQDAEEQNLYVHDPSGFYSRLKWDDDRQRYAEISWQEFSAFNWTQLIVEPSGTGQHIERIE